MFVPLFTAMWAMSPYRDKRLSDPIPILSRIAYAVIGISLFGIFIWHSHQSGITRLDLPTFLLFSLGFIGEGLRQWSCIREASDDAVYQVFTNRLFSQIFMDKVAKQADAP